VEPLIHAPRVYQHRRAAVTVGPCIHWYDPGRCQRPRTNAKPLRAGEPGYRPNQPITGGNSTPRGEHQERRERLEWQIRRDEKRLAEIEGRLAMLGEAT
jgi:hypothetical protein